MTSPFEAPTVWGGMTDRGKARAQELGDYEQI